MGYYDVASEGNPKVTELLDEAIKLINEAAYLMEEEKPGTGCGSFEHWNKLLWSVPDTLRNIRSARYEMGLDEEEPEYPKDYSSW